MNQKGSPFMAQLDALFGPLFLVLVLTGIIISFFVDGTSGFAILVAMALGVTIDAWGEDYVTDLRIDEKADTFTLSLEQPFSGKPPREQVMGFTNLHRIRYEPRTTFRQKATLHLFTHNGEEHIFRTMPAMLDLARVNAAIEAIRRTEAPASSTKVPSSTKAAPAKSTATTATNKASTTKTSSKTSTSKSRTSKSPATKRSGGKSTSSKSSGKSQDKPAEPKDSKPGA
jgi:hypothetical protein